MRLLNQTNTTTLSRDELKKISELEAKVRTLKEQLESAQKDLKLTAVNMTKVSEMLADISIVQKVHIDQTTTLQAEIDTLMALLFPKDEIKYDLMNEPYN